MSSANFRLLPENRSQQALIKSTSKSAQSNPIYGMLTGHSGPQPIIPKKTSAAGVAADVLPATVWMSFKQPTGRRQSLPPL